MGKRSHYGTTNDMDIQYELLYSAKCYFDPTESLHLKELHFRLVTGNRFVRPQKVSTTHKLDIESRLVDTVGTGWMCRKPERMLVKLRCHLIAIIIIPSTYSAAESFA